MINRKYMRILFILYLLILMKVIIFKFPLEVMRQIAASWKKEVFWEGLNGANFELFRTIKLYVRHWDNKGINSFGNLIGNIIAFIPLGYLMPRLHKIFENLFLCMATALLFILGIELFQLFSAFGIFDVDDILLNGLGTFIGYLCFVLMKLLTKKNKKD
ncbi:MAG: VanZ family protein [Lachnospiraceae bacterium]|nr:VanZ family protein [Lachnospiraceae bacterium]